MKNALLYMTHVWTPEIQSEFEKLYFMKGSEIPETWLLLDSKTHGSSEIAKRYERCHLFDVVEMMRLPYPHNEGSKFVDHAHFSLLDFYFKHPGFDFYWFIEYDVHFTGKWETFLITFNSFNHDFIASHIRRYAQEPFWNWWKNFLHPSKTFPEKDLIRSFNVVFRISNRALQFIHEIHIDGWRGLNESIFPTLLYNNGFTLLDFGGNGEFVAPRLQEPVLYIIQHGGWESDSGNTAFPAAAGEGRFQEELYLSPHKTKGYVAV